MKSRKSSSAFEDSVNKIGAGDEQSTARAAPAAAAQNEYKPLKLIQELYQQGKNEQAAAELAAHIQVNSFSIENIVLKMQIEESGDQIKQAMATADFCILIQPWNAAACAMKVKLLQKFARFRELSDSLVMNKRLNPKNALV